MYFSIFCSHLYLSLTNYLFLLLAAAGLAQQVSPDSTGSPETSYGPYGCSLPQRSRSSPAVTPDSTKPLHTSETPQTSSSVDLKSENYDPEGSEKSLAGPNSVDPGHHSRSLGVLEGSHHGFEDAAGNHLRRLQVTTSEYGDGSVEQARSESIDGGEIEFCKKKLILVLNLVSIT